MESNKLITVLFATIHRSQGENETSIVVNVNTRQAIPHVHYVGLYRVTTMDGLYVTDFCESKMWSVLKFKQLKLSITPIY